LDEMNRPLRILQMAHVRWYNAEAQYAHDLSLECRRLGHKVVFFTQSGSPVAGKARKSGFDTFEESGFNAKGLAAANVFPALLRFLRLLDREKFDAVEIHRSEVRFLIAGVCRLRGIPIIGVRGDKRPVRKDPFNRFIYRKALSGIVASNHTIASDLEKSMGPLPFLRTIHGGIDPEIFSPEGSISDIRSELGLPDNAMLVGIVGRLGGDKGHFDFLAAAQKSISRHERLHFVILAKQSNHLENELRRRIDAGSRLKRHTSIIGYQPDLPAVLRAFDVGVVASTDSEANCRVGLEWMASGVPLIGTRIGVLPDLIDSGKTGFLVSPRAPGELAGRIGQLAAQPTMARQLGLQSRQRVLKHFTINICARKHLALIYDLIKKQGRRPKVNY